MLTSSVYRRRVYYISGFDPRGPGFYYRFMRRQARRARGAYVLSERTPSPPHAARWTIRYHGPEGDAETEYVFLRWDDIARRRWGRSALWLTVRLVGCVPHYMRARIWGTARRSSRASYLAAWYPPVCVLLLNALACVAALGAGAFCKAAGFPPEASYASALAVLPAFIHTAGLAAEKLKALWMMRVFIFYRDWAKGKAPEIEARLMRFAERIAADAERDAAQSRVPDEVLVTGHSVGAALAPRALAGALRLLSSETPKDHFALMTLGHSVPLLGRGNARAELYLRDASLLHGAGLRWDDYASSADGACFARVNPSLGAHPGVHLQSPRFHAFTPQALYRKWKRNPYFMHFLYLTSPVLPGGFDYMALTARPGHGARVPQTAEDEAHAAPREPEPTPVSPAVEAGDAFPNAFAA